MVTDVVIAANFAGKQRIAVLSTGGCNFLTDIGMHTGSRTGHGVAIATACAFVGLDAVLCTGRGILDQRVVVIAGRHEISLLVVAAVYAGVSGVTLILTGGGHDLGHIIVADGGHEIVFAGVSTNLTLILGVALVLTGGGYRIADLVVMLAVAGEGLCFQNGAADAAVAACAQALLLTVAGDRRILHRLMSGGGEVILIGVAAQRTGMGGVTLVGAVSRCDLGDVLMLADNSFHIGDLEAPVVQHAVGLELDLDHAAADGNGLTGQLVAGVAAHQFASDVIDVQVIGLFFEEGFRCKGQDQGRSIFIRIDPEVIAVCRILVAALELLQFLNLIAIVGNGDHAGSGSTVTVGRGGRNGGFALTEGKNHTVFVHTDHILIGAGPDDLLVCRIGGGHDRGELVSCQCLHGQAGVTELDTGNGDVVGIDDGNGAALADVSAVGGGCGNGRGAVAHGGDGAVFVNDGHILIGGSPGQDLVGSILGGDGRL